MNIKKPITVIIVSAMFIQPVFAACENELKDTNSSFIDGDLQKIREDFNTTFSSSNTEAIKNKLNYYQNIPDGPPYPIESNYKPALTCMIGAYKTRLSELSTKPTGQYSQTNPKQEVGKNISYFSDDSKCLKVGTDSEGHQTYTNTCKTRVTYGYCHVVVESSNDGTQCKSIPSAFSRSGVNYVTQGGGLEPGQTHTKAYIYDHTQFTFLVACRSGRNPLIESFNSKMITSNSKARSSCWAYVTK